MNDSSHTIDRAGPGAAAAAAPTALKNNATCQLAVRCSPEMSDPSEFHTIVISSVRSLFGQLESHSFGLEVKLPTQQQPLGVGELTSEQGCQAHHFTVECPQESVDAVRAALTMATTHQFGTSTVYRLDVINVKCGVPS
jgi:RNase P/RNase MRP subunit POP5